MTNRRKNMSNAMMAALGTSLPSSRTKVAYANFAQSDLVLEKIASMFIHQPTMENVDLFIRKHIMNELAFYPRALDVDIEIIPSAFSDESKGYISDATGLIKIKMGKAMPEIPFLIRDGELFPFDIIQMNGERAPFTRDNLKKTIYGVDKVNNQKREGAALDPFESVDKVITPATSTGFLGDVLYIRDQNRSSTVNGNNYVTASDDFLNSLIEKTANMKELTIDDIKLIKEAMEKKDNKDISTGADILAADDAKSAKIAEHSKELKAVNKVQYFDIKDMSNNSIVKVPVKEGSSGISSTQVLVVKEPQSIVDGCLEKLTPFIVDNNGRTKRMDTEILCTMPTQGTLSAQTSSVSSLINRDRCIFVSGENVSTIYFVNEAIDRKYMKDFHGNEGENTCLKGVNLIHYDELCDNESLVLSKSKKKTKISMFFVEGYQMKEVTRDEAAEILSKECLMDKDKIKCIMPNYSSCENVNCRIMITSPNTKCIKIKNETVPTVKNRQELDLILNIDEIGTDPLSKIASGPGDVIRIDNLGSSKTFKIVVRYTDRNTRIFNQKVRTYDSAGEFKVRAILRVLGFEAGRINELMYKLKKDPFVQVSLPQNADVDALDGGDTKNLSKEKLSNTIGKFISPNELATAIITQASIGLIGSALKSSAKNINPAPFARDFINVSKKASTESVEFEKIAMEHKSASANRVAKVLAIGTMLIEKTASTIDGSAVYPEIRKIASDMVNNKDVLESVVEELIHLKVAQAMHGNEMVSNSQIHNAINSIDTIYKVASAINSVRGK
ncbi:MAG: hypothetical protein RR420_01270 [Anaerovoracaceae bacterium]